jgi:lysophospholipase L1-like esterase
MTRLSTKKKVVFSLLVTVAIIASLEGLARLYFWARSTRDVEDAVIDRFHPMRYDLAPGRTLPANGPMARVNNVGLRGEDADVPKRRTRILCLGDSATFGYAPDVTDSATYPARLGALLEARHPGKFEVLNGGRPSFSTLDCLGFFSYRAAELKPDVVVLMMGWNDTHLAHPLHRPPDKVAPQLFASSALMKMAALVVGRVVKPRPPTSSDLRTALKRLPRPTDGLSRDVFARDERALEDLARLCLAHGAKPILVRLASPVRDGWTDVDSLTDEEVRVMTPHLIGGELSPGGWTRFVREVNAGVDRIGRKLGLPVVDAADLRDPRQFVDVCHPNAEGNRVLAEAVARAIVPDRRSNP